ncbi:hypothetical protein PMZ80_004464 [Knufia obscura]|uniref:Uncharacterized protein n=2 Tax=Knufia TaxID=430999 RepID=A0AAN8ET50_9EURO|nr:hypothetical protein PMZ80_004464 [Knufia obscura]KAK5951658.1 hypothetical protein OHC33_007337 [Knufia fluminis]
MSGFRDQVFYDSSRDNGFFSPITATANFCEEDYAISYYIGEFISTLSNVAYIYFAIYPPKLSLQSKPYGKTSNSRMIWDVHTASLMSIGITSAIFHASLRSFPQFLDESSMYFLVAGFSFDLLTTSYRTIAGKPAITKHHRTLAATVILLAICTTSVITLVTGDLIIHTFVFATGILICGIKMSGLIRKHDKSTRSKLYWHLFTADMALNLGLGLWIIDCTPAYCAMLRNFRGQLIDTFPAPLGLLLGFVTELHGWWHFFTARAAAEFISLIRYLTTTVPDELDRKESKVNGTVNGKVNGKAT